MILKKIIDIGDVLLEEIYFYYSTSFSHGTSKLQLNYLNIAKLNVFDKSTLVFFQIEFIESNSKRDDVWNASQLVQFDYNDAKDPFVLL